MMSSQSPDHMDIEDLRDEIRFQRALLETIDDAVANKDEARKAVKDEIRILEKELKQRTRPKITASSSQPQVSSQMSHRKPSSSKLQHASSQQPHHIVESSDLDGSLNHQADQSSTTSTPASTNSSGEFLTPSKIDLPTRKRSHSNMNGHLRAFDGNKSRRTSPSPYQTTLTTPDESSGDEEFEAFDRGFFKKQQEDEERRFSREKQDAEFARSLQDQPMDVAPISSASRPSAFDRLSGSRPSIFQTSSSSDRKPTLSSSSLGLGGSSTSLKLESNPQLTASNLKRERPSSSYSMPGTFRDNSSDSDSDIEIISSTAFHPNGRHLNSTPRSAPQKRTSNSNRHASLYSVPSYDMGTSSSSAMGMQGAGTGGYGYPSASMGQRVNGVPGMGSIGGHPNKYANPFTSPYNPSGGIQNNTTHFGAGLGYTANTLPGYGINQPSFGPGVSHFGLQHNAYQDPASRIALGLPWNDRMQEQYDYVVNDPHKTKQEIQELIENIRPDSDLPPEDREGTPEALVYPLYEHQKLALTWLKTMEKGTNKGGILADDMGLGKTISSLALILTRPSTDRAKKTTLIVGPVALVRQWQKELRVKVKPGHRLSTHLLHGQKTRKSWDDLRNYDVVLTTYGTLGAEFTRFEKYKEKKKIAGLKWQETDQGTLRKDFPLLGPKTIFYRVIIDEAQYIKNKATVAARACCHLQSTYRWCLTGTPMMNNIGELYSLIHFLRIKPYNEWARFQDQFKTLVPSSRGVASASGRDQAMRKLQALLKAILLRRTKTSLIDGKPIINLPPKTEEIQHVVFNNEEGGEHEFYTSLETKSRVVMNKYLKAGTVGKNYSNVLVLLLRLRQACCHPHLIQDFEEAASAAGIELSVEAMMELAKGLQPQVVARILAAEDNFTCSVCYDGVENPSIFIPCGHDTCPECLSRITDHAAVENAANGEEVRTPGGKCPECRGKIEMNKVIDYASFKKVYKPDPSKHEPEPAEDDSNDTDTDSDSDSEAEEDDANSDGDLRNFIVPDAIEDDTTDEEDNLIKNDEDEEDEEDEPENDDAEDVSRKSKLKTKREAFKRQKKGKGKQKAKKPKKEHLSIAMLKKEASRSAEGRRRYMRRLRKEWKPSAKLTKCIELLDKFQAEGEKTIIFSQFVSLLDLLQVPIEQKKWDFERYDGSMSGEARNDAINRFTDKPNTKVMLISLKAGNAGLNLVAASRVIILDPFWNPFIEMQAVDRAYRIGQQKSVEVHRILVEKTVEDRIIELQEKKRKMVETALDEGASKDMGRLTINDLRYLFGVGDGTENGSGSRN